MCPMCSLEVRNLRMFPSSHPVQGRYCWGNSGRGGGNAPSSHLIYVHAEGKGDADAASASFPPPNEHESRKRSKNPPCWWTCWTDVPDEGGRDEGGRDEGGVVGQTGGTQGSGFQEVDRKENY